MRTRPCPRGIQRPLQSDVCRGSPGRPAEELYHTAADPYEMTNLAADPRHARIQAQLSAELDRWLAEQGDPGIPQDTHEAHHAAQRGEHRYVPK